MTLAWCPYLTPFEQTQPSISSWQISTLLLVTLGSALPAPPTLLIYVEMVDLEADTLFFHQEGSECWKQLPVNLFVRNKSIVVGMINPLSPGDTVCEHVCSYKIPLRSRGMFPALKLHTLYIRPFVLIFNQCSQDLRIETVLFIWVLIPEQYAYIVGVLSTREGVGLWLKHVGDTDQCCSLNQKANILNEDTFK